MVCDKSLLDFTLIKQILIDKYVGKSKTINATI